MSSPRIYVAGTIDTKCDELAYIKEILVSVGLPAVIVDLSTKPHVLASDISANDVAQWHPGGVTAVFTGDRGTAVTAMAEAFALFMASRIDVAGLIGIGGSGGTALVAAGMRALPIGMPKLLVSTIASGQVAGYVGPSDICMMYSVTDLAGLNRILRVILANAAHAIAGMVKSAVRSAEEETQKPAVGLTMFGVTTHCVNQLLPLLSDTLDCLVFHATGTGGQSMEKLVDSRLLTAIVDVTTTEVCDLLMGGIFPANEDRFGAIARTGIPYVISLGALDMVNFGKPETVPAKYAGRLFYRHNPQVTLMRTTPEENVRMGEWIGERLNRCHGQVRLLIPELGVSLLDSPGNVFYDPEADAALFSSLERTLKPTAKRRLQRLPLAINDPLFSKALADHLREALAEA